jgi:tRNA(Ile)-lysidine synthase
MAGLCFERRLAENWAPSDWSDLTVLVAVSGGADSIALLRGLAALRRPGPGRLIVAHLNHALRPESAEDERFVVELSRDLSLNCEVGRANVAERAAEIGDGVEAAARHARYEFLQATAERLGARYVATAHTADDQAETILHRVLRGTGLAGLAGIPRSRPLGPAVTLLRPMLGLRRADVTAYLAELEQPFREDKTNADCRFTRNRLRHDLLPQLAEEYNPQAAEALLRLGRLAGEAHSVVSSIAESMLAATLREQSPDRLSINCRALQGHSPYLVREALLLAWRSQGWPEQAMGLEQWDQLAALVRQQPAATANMLTLPGAILATRSRDELTLRKSEVKSQKS